MFCFCFFSGYDDIYPYFFLLFIFASICLIVNLLWLAAYNVLGQKISVANIWRDPHHLSSYLKGNEFLPKFTSQATAAMKANFVRVNKTVFCVGSGPSYDGGIEPWQVRSKIEK